MASVATPSRRHSTTTRGSASVRDCITPPWRELICESDSRWEWTGQKLIHRDHQTLHSERRPNNRLQKLFVEHVYATQKSSPAVRRCLDQLVEGLGNLGWGLNLGAGDTELTHRVLNLDIHDAPHMHIINCGSALPFKDDSLDLVISQEVLEHIADPFETISEVHRVLKPGGKFFCQIPFMIGFHPGPCDYWRFTRQAFEHTFDNTSWQLRELELSLGHGSGFYRILVEFLAVNASIVSQQLYKPAKAAGALMFYPLQWLDALTAMSAEKDRIPGGYFCVAEKKARDIMSTDVAVQN